MIKGREIKERELVIQEMIDRGQTLSQMARALGLTSQAVHKFLKVRNWKTHEMERRDKEAMTVQKKKTAKEERKKKRQAMGKKVDNPKAAKS